MSTASHPHAPNRSSARKDTGEDRRADPTLMRNQNQLVVATGTTWVLIALITLAAVGGMLYLVWDMGARPGAAALGVALGSIVVAMLGVRVFWRAGRHRLLALAILYLGMLATGVIGMLALAATAG